MLTPAGYLLATQKVAAADAYFNAHCVTGRGGWRSLDTTKYPDHPEVNKERGEIEAYNFAHNNSGEGEERYFAYYNAARVTHEITTWTGDTLAKVVWRGLAYRSGFGGKRINFRAQGIDGHLYAGTYFTSSGSYVRMRRIKR